LPKLRSSDDVLAGDISVLSGNAEVVNQVGEVLPDPRVVLVGWSLVSVEDVSLPSNEVLSDDGADSVTNGELVAVSTGEVVAAVDHVCTISSWGR